MVGANRQDASFTVVCQPLSQRHASAALAASAAPARKLKAPVGYSRQPVRCRDDGPPRLGRRLRRDACVRGAPTWRSGLPTRPPVRWACAFGTSMPRAIYADVPADDVVMAHQLDPRRVSFLDGVQRGLRNRAARQPTACMCARQRQRMRPCRSQVTSDDGPSDSSGSGAAPIARWPIFRREGRW